MFLAAIAHNTHTHAEYTAVNREGRINRIFSASDFDLLAGWLVAQAWSPPSELLKI